MQEGDIILKIRLPNGIWTCVCTEVAAKRGAPGYTVTITPPGDYTLTPIVADTAVPFRFTAEHMEFCFGAWPYAETEFFDELECELSAKLIKKKMME